MHFEWDENKRLANLAKHGVDFDVGVRILLLSPEWIKDADAITAKRAMLSMGSTGGEAECHRVHAPRRNDQNHFRAQGQRSGKEEI